MESLKPHTVRAIVRHSIGIGALGLIVAGVWGRWGWEWGLITAGLPPALFYVWGELRVAGAPTTGEVE